MSRLTDKFILIAHADWSVNPDKRWVASAVRKSGGELQAGAPLKAPGNLLKSLLDQAGETGNVLVGFDFPIGLPSEYACRTGVTSFLESLPLFGSGLWQEFFHPARRVEEIGLNRPFYPMLRGGTQREHLERELDIPFTRLYRSCERARPGRRAACPIFWTMGGQQVGKAAISGWQEILQPDLSDPQIQLVIWPFSGRLEDLVREGYIIAAETYPAEFYNHLNITFSSPRAGRRSGKRSQADRAANAGRLLDWSHKLHIHLDAPLTECIKTGFGPSTSGEDPFDAVIGLFGMINALEHWCTEYEPHGNILRSIEGWIFGMPQEHGAARET